MVVLLEVGPVQLEALAERFRQAIERVAVTLSNGQWLNLTASIGAALVGPDGTMQAALRRVDNALYAAKRAGRNRVDLKRSDTDSQKVVAS